MAHYETTDIFKGAFLLCKGGDLSGISFNDRKIATFAIRVPGSGDTLIPLFFTAKGGKLRATAGISNQFRAYF